MPMRARGSSASSEDEAWGDDGYGDAPDKPPAATPAGAVPPAPKPAPTPGAVAVPDWRKLNPNPNPSPNRNTNQP